MRRTDMSRLLPTVLLLLVPLSGCGSDEGIPVGREAPTPGATESAAPAEPAATPVWPPPDCVTMSGMSQDFVAGTPGLPTAQEAVLDQIPEGVSVVRGPKPEPHQQRLWWVLDADGVVIAATNAFEGEDGWLVGYVERCGDRPVDR